MGMALVAHGEEQHQELVLAVETTGTALVEDDLDATREGAATIVDLLPENDPMAAPVGELAESESLEAAREHFQTLSLLLIERIEEVPGYYIMSCPMVENGYWVQTTEEVANPYMGQRMVRCGGVDRKTGNPSSSSNPAGSDRKAASARPCCGGS